MEGGHIAGKGRADGSAWYSLVSRLPVGIFRFRAQRGAILAVDYVNGTLMDLFGGDPCPVSAFRGGMETRVRAGFERDLSASLEAGQEFRWLGEVRIAGVPRFLRLLVWPERALQAGVWTGMVEDQSADRRFAIARKLAVFKLGELEEILCGTASGPFRDSSDARSSWSALSSREREVAACLLEGLTNAQTAERLGITCSTSKKHVNAVFRKLGVRTRLELFAVAHGPR